MSRVALSPEAFTLVKFDAARMRAIAQEVLAAVGFPADVAVAIEVDEVLPHPLTGSEVAVVDGRAELWFTGGCFEDPQRLGELHEDNTRVELGAALLRARDRLSPGFAGAPADNALTERQRAIWDAYAEGRLTRVDGFHVREPRRRYTFRLHCGFSDVADAAYARIWNADVLTWADLEGIAAALDAVDPGRRKKKPAVRRDTLRAS